MNARKQNIQNERKATRRGQQQETENGMDV